MKFKTVKKLISCALPAWLLLGSGQNLIGSARFWSVPARFWSVPARFWWVHVISSTSKDTHQFLVDQKKFAKKHHTRLASLTAAHTWLLLHKIWYRGT